MTSKLFQPTGSGSLGETRRPRTLEAFSRFNQEETKKSVQRFTILIAEDDDDTRLMMRTLLETKGYAVYEAREGNEALQRAFLKRPDLVFLDLELAGLDGLNVSQGLRQMAQTRRVPIIIISGWDPAVRRDAALAAGCNEYLLKPIDFEKLDALLNRYLPLS